MSASSLKILILGDSRSFHLERYVAELRHQGCEAIVASLEPGSVCDHRLKRRGWFTWLHYPLCAREIGRLIRETQPDIVNPHFASGYGFSVALTQMRERVPTILHVWGSDILIVPEKSSLHRRKTAYALNSAACVIADSAYLLAKAREVGPVHRAEVIPWGIERRHLRRHKQDYRLSKPLRIIVPRPHERIYNNLFILRALAPLVNAGAVALTFPAFGSLADEFRSFAVNMVDREISYYEQRSRDDFLDLVASHDVYLSAALSDSSPASMIEAMALGLIPIAADIPGVREWLTAASGYRFESFVDESLRDVIHKIIETNDPHEEMRRRNRERVLRDAIFEENISRTLAIMRELRTARRA